MKLPPIPGPRDLLGVAERVTGLLTSAEDLLARASALIDRIEQTRVAAYDLVVRSERTQSGLDELVTRIEPSLIKLQPTLERLAETTDPREVDALVQLVDHLPMLVVRLETDVIPVMQKLQTVAPDVHELLEVTRELNEMLAKLPGMGRIRKRVDRELAQDDT